ncbi:Holliday junction DNA helicase subunit RuvA [Nitrosomonas eutropha]|uniref:Holliday junction branch migration protein RuvA n=1 Tax=Nitrosomonas TaxID=914 RepID=UPI00089D511E|nr:Holliday junction branch migration protein RuvA [Nitrosomonas eutropha]MXS80941.1 Holliday junction branch migration protein RuvA [Nitrosomonas sp. GH22]SDW15686.1 Holliday junction DNA helicase subunit RuvA [Nitrosomonas eutropha]
MIGRITGLLLEKHPPLVLVDVQGTGYEIDVPMSTFCKLPDIGKKVTLHTHFWVREDVHLLFGFMTEQERALFRQLTKISGIGARTGLAILSGLSVTDLHQAVVSQDSIRLTKIPGIGKKTAERLLLELRDKIDPVAILSETGPTASNVDKDILSALLALGYNGREVNRALEQLSEGVTVSDGIMQSLKFLSKVK